MENSLSFFRLDYEYFSLDFLPELPGLAKFRQSYENRAVFMIEDLEVPYLNYNDLIVNKQTQARPKDLEDIEQLKLRRHGSE